RVIFDSIIYVFEKLSDDIQAFVEITDSSAASVKRTHGGFHKFVSLISVSNVLIIVLINGGLEISIGDGCFFMVFLLFLNDPIEENSGHFPEILDQLSFSERMCVVKSLEVRNG
ncbi:hypothetical protein Tco_0075727, partial [Tanacetum coccineum]